MKKSLTNANTLGRCIRRRSWAALFCALSMAQGSAAQSPPADPIATSPPPPPAPTTSTAPAAPTEPQAPEAEASAAPPSVSVVLPSDSAQGPGTPGALPTGSSAVPLAPRSAEATPVVSPADVDSPPQDQAASPPGTRAGVGDEAAGKAKAAKLTPTRFQALEPGRSQASDVLEQLGEPLQKVKGETGEETIWSYEVGPFPRVELTVQQNRVESIFVKVAGLPDVSEVSKQLHVERFRGAVVQSRTGEPLGVVYPEGGVMLSLRPREEDEGYGVFSIMLEPIHAELFVTRARNTDPAQCTQRIADLDTALGMSPEHAEALGLKARIYASIGETRKALRLAEAARAAGSEHAADWLLLTARLKAELGDTEQADQIIQRLLATGPPDVLHAESLLLKGDLQAMLGKHDEALVHHKRAIEIVKKYSNSEILEVRRGALGVLANGHLAIANDIAWGNWRRKAEVAPMWVKNGHAYADLLIALDHVEPVLAQRVQRLTLSAYAGFAEAVDPTNICQEAVRHAQALLESTRDPLHQRRIEWELAETMYHAMIAERRRGAYDSAIEYAKVASPLFTKTQERRELTPRETFMVGQLHFLAGSCLAIEAERHDAAVQWYKRGALVLLQPFPPAVVGDRADLGDQLVSMGVSFWKTGDKERAIAITTRGVQILQSAASQPETQANSQANSQADTLKSLHIAYSNLAAMLQSAGRKAEAEKWRQRLSQLPRATR